MAAEKSARLHASTTPGAQVFRMAFTCRESPQGGRAAFRVPCFLPRPPDQVVLVNRHRSKFVPPESTREIQHKPTSRVSNVENSHSWHNRYAGLLV